MSTDLALPDWNLAPLTAEELGPYGDFPRLADADKAALWTEYNEGRAERVPVTYGINNRVLILDPRFNLGHWRYDEIFEDPRAMLVAQLHWQHLVRNRYHVFCDQPTELPDQWEVAPFFQNVYEAASFGAPISCGPNDVPTTTPILEEDNKRSIFDADIDHPLELGICQRGIEMTGKMREIADGRTFLGRPISVLPYAELGSDGPLTGALNLRGAGIFRDLKRDPDYAHQLMDFIVEAAIRRVRAFRAHWDLPQPDQAWLADDAIVGLSIEQYREFILPHHRKWYDAIDPQRTLIRGMHLCGDATRHFEVIHRELGVTAFDTGYPVDFGALRRALGPDVEILGGVEVPLLMSAAPQRIYERGREILESGVTDGERFVFREGNNLPPGVPWANLAALYKAAWDFGRHA